MGIELAKMFVKIRGDHTALPEDFEAAKEVANANMRDIADSMAGVFSKAQGIRQFLDKGIAAATSYEQTVTEFETLIGSAEETQATLGRLTKFAVSTPFEMPQLLGVSRGLLQFGERGEGMMRTLKTLGDVSQGSAEKFGVLGMVFNQVRAESKLTRENFMQLANRGLISLQDISSYFFGTTKNAAQADKMMRDGKITFEDFRKILEKTTEAGGKNHNAMERQSTTLGGLNSTLGDAINITGRLLAQPLMPYLKAITQVQIKVAEGFAAIIEKMGPAASGMAVGAAAASSLGLALTSASLAARFFGISLRAAIIGTGVGAVIILIAAAIGGVAMWLMEAVKKTAIWKETLELLAKSWEILKEAIGVVANSLLDVWENVFGESLTSSIERAANYIAGLIKKVAEWVIAAKTTIMGVAEGIAFFFRNFRALMEINMIDSQIKTITRFQEIQLAFIKIWAAAGGYFGAFVDKFMDGLTRMRNMAAAVWEAVKAGFLAAFDPEGPGVAEAVRDAFEKGLAEAEKQNGDGNRMIDPVARAKKAALEAEREFNADRNGPDSLVAQLERRKKELKDQIEKDEEERRNRKKPPKAPEEETSGAPPETPTAPKQKVEAGRYGFEAFSTKFQDALLKQGANDQQKRMVGLMEHANATQDQLLVEAKKQKGGLAP